MKYWQSTEIKNYQKLIEQRFNNQNDLKQPNLKPNELFFDAAQQIKKISSMNPISLQHQKYWKSREHKAINFDTKPLEPLSAFKTSSLDESIKKPKENQKQPIIGIGIGGGPPNTNTNHVW